VRDHLSPSQRNDIRYHIRATEQGIARKYGISVEVVRDVRRRGQPQHPARLAARARRLGDNPIFDPAKITSGAFASPEAGLVRHEVVPATDVEPPRGQLHVEGGVDLPVPLA